MDADLPRKPGQRRQSFSTRSLMLAVVVVAAGLGLWLALTRSARRIDAVSDRLSALVQQTLRDDPSIEMRGMSKLGRGDGPLGTLAKIQYWRKTPTYRKITITVEVRAGLLRDGPDRLRFETMGRSVELPFDDLERDPKVDLRAMFPEAFR